MQSLIMAVSIYTHLTWSKMVGLKRCGGCDNQLTLSFYIEEITFHKTNIKVSEKMNYRKF